MSRLLYMQIQDCVIRALWLFDRGKLFISMFVRLTRVAPCDRNIIGATFDINETPVSATINGWLVSAR